MNTSRAILIVIALLIGGGIGYYFGFDRGAETPVTTDTSDAAGTREEDRAGNVGGGEFQWVMVAMDDGLEAPRTELSLRAGTRTYAIGEYYGSCAEDDTDFLEGQISKVVCWYAGGGNEIGIFEENGTRVVKVGEVDEGTAEEGGFRGNFETVLELE
jgi:hypothetical protein